LAGYVLEKMNDLERKLEGFSGIERAATEVNLLAAMVAVARRGASLSPSLI